MVRLTLNVDQETFDSAGRTFDPVPIGPYTATIFEIKETEVKTGANAGKPRLKFQFRIVDGETSPAGQNQGNRRLFSDVNAFEGFSQKTQQNTPPYELIDIGKAIGLSHDEINNIDTDDMSDWLGKELQLTVTHVKKQHQVDGSWVDIEPAEYREKVRGYRSLESVNTSAVATAKVTGKAPTGAKAGGTAAKKPQLIKL